MKGFNFLFFLFFCDKPNTGLKNMQLLLRSVNEHSRHMWQIVLHLFIKKSHASFRNNERTQTVFPFHKGQTI